MKKSKPPIITKEDLKPLSDLGIFDPYISTNEVWIIYASLGAYNGWAIIAAKSNASARYYIRRPGTGWLTEARITKIIPIMQSTHKDEIKELKDCNKFPKEYGQWFELEWGY